MRDGKLNKCKDCTKDDAKKHRDENLSKIREYDRDRGARQSNQYLKNYREKYPNKYKAQTKVNNLLRYGKIEKPKRCESCNFELRIVAHHDNYLKPLEVKWLCQSCHKQWHSKNGEGING
jgi:hypothetical protein